MNLSRIKLVAFFLALLLLGWFLYPSSLFLGFIYEGTSELKQAENYYQKYLSKRPFNKRATLRLAKLYERMGEPDRSITLLKELYEHRPQDWKVARLYLDQLETSHRMADIYRAKFKIAQDFMTTRKLHKAQIEGLLYNALQGAIWLQKTDDIYTILSHLIRVAHDPESFRSLLHQYDLGLKKTARVVDYLQQELAANPHDEGTREEIASVFLVTGDLQAALKILNQGLSLNSKSVGLLKKRSAVLEQMKKYPEAIDDIRTILSLSPLQTDIKRECTRQLAYLLEKNNQVDEAIGVLLQYLEENPDSPVEEKSLAGLYLYRQKTLAPMEFYARFVHKYQDEGLALDVAALLSDRKLTQESIQWLKEITALFPQNQKIILALAEAYERAGLDQDALEEYQRLSKDFRRRPTVLQSLAYLHTKLGQKKEAAALYVQLAEQNPHNASLLKLAGRELLFLEQRKPAIRYLNESLQRSRQDAETWFWLAEAYQAGTSQDDTRIRKASGEVLNLLKGKKNRTKEEDYFYTQAKKANQKYDHRITTLYRIEDLGANQTMEWGLRYRGWLSDHWTLTAETWAGRYRSDTIGFVDDAEHGHFSLTSHHLPNWQLTGGLGFGVSTRRTAVSPTIGLIFQPNQYLKLTTEFAYRALRTDLVEAVAAGVLHDHAQLKWEYHVPGPWHDRLLFSGNYDFQRSYAASGTSALTHRIEPVLSYLILKKPSLSLGYQYTFSQVDDQNSFLSEVPLIRKVNAHYLVGYLAGKAAPTLLLEGGFFVGHDVARGLKFWQGDLWGISSGLTWNILSWLDLETFYYFASENISGKSGRTHQGRVGLSGHWR